MMNEITKIRALQKPEKYTENPREKSVFRKGFVGWKWTISLQFPLPLFHSHWNSFTVLKRCCFPFKIIFHVASEEKLYLKINVNSII